jgi:small-conductance mechanosensitive channel
MTLLDNPLGSWGIAFAVAAGATAIMACIRTVALSKVRALALRTATRLDDLVAAMLGSTYLLFLGIIGLYLGSQFLQFPPQRQAMVSRVAIIAFLVQVAIWGDVVLRSWRTNMRGHTPVNDAASRNSTTVLCFLVRMALWIVVALMILDNMGVNITALVASLGIGGIAVALAVQNILGDLFASLSITLDKPFEVGDFIIVGDALGTVEFIGLKTTRVRGLGGEQVIFSNADLLKSRVHNHKRMQTRRASFIIRLAYGTSEAHLRSVPQTVRAIVSAQPQADFERAHFSALGEWSLDFEVVYHIKTPDYNIYMDVQQAIYLALYRQFAREGIEFAYPTQNLRLLPAEPPEVSGTVRRPSDRSA